eukprot:3835755-Prymnesium_polylepis.2
MGENQRAKEIDLSLFMDRSPHVVNPHMTLVRVYRLFNELGVRHVPVVGTHNELIGILVRKGACRPPRLNVPRATHCLCPDNPVCL